jgi:hypothetical protein
VRSIRSRAPALGWLASGVLIGGLLVGGAWYASTHNLTADLFDTPAGQGTSRGQAVPHYSAGPTPTIVPGVAQYPASAPKPAQTNSRRPTGEVTEINQSPSTFTIRTPDGELLTFEVRLTTVFMAGHLRPYSFERLKPGDEVVVRDGPDKVPAPNASPVLGGGKVKGTTAHTNIAPRPASGELIARQVMVRPAGEQARGKKGQTAGGTQTSQSVNGPASAQDGGTDGTGQ